MLKAPRAPRGANAPDRERPGEKSERRESRRARSPVDAEQLCAWLREKSDDADLTADHMTSRGGDHAFLLADSLRDRARYLRRLEAAIRRGELEAYAACVSPEQRAAIALSGEHAIDAEALPRRPR